MFELFVSVGLCRLDREIEIVVAGIAYDSRTAGKVCGGAGVSVAVVLAVAVAGI